MPIDITNKEEKQIALTGAEIESALLKANDIQSSASEIDNMVTNGATQADLEALALSTGNLTPEQSKMIDDLITSDLITVGKNLFDKSKITDNKYVAFSTGTLVDNTSFVASDFIEIETNTTYSFTYIHQLAFYDENKNFISGLNLSKSFESFTSISNCSYVRFGLLKSYLDIEQLEEGNSLTSYEIYKGTYIKPTYLLSVDDIDFYSSTKNLFDKNKIFKDFYISTVNGSLLQSVGFSTSSFIEVLGGFSYVMSGNGANGWSAFYDENFLFISSVVNLSTATISPINAKYLKVSFPTVNINRVQVEQNTVSTYYMPRKIESTEYKYYKNKLLDKKWATLGDSLTVSTGWQKIVEYDNQLFLSTHGIVASKISQEHTNSFINIGRINGINIDTDIITIMGGTNDWIQSIPLGIEDSFDVTTFNGALNVLVQRLCNRFSDKKIIFFTPPYAENTSGFVGLSWSNAKTNLKGLTINDYAFAVKNICFNNNIQCIDVNSLCGWNTYTITNYTTDGIHFTEKGHSRLGGIISKEFFNMGL